MFKEFKAFILRGSVIDLAIAVVIALAFAAVIGYQKPTDPVARHSR